MKEMIMPVKVFFPFKLHINFFDLFKIVSDNSYTTYDEH